MNWKIPKMLDPLGKHWGQPKDLRDRVGLYETHATIPEQDWLRLSNYRTTNPSGVYPGKVWRSGPFLAWYGPAREVGTGTGTRVLCRVCFIRALVQ